MYFEKGDDFSQEEERVEGLHVLGSLTGTHTKKYKKQKRRRGWQSY